MDYIYHIINWIVEKLYLHWIALAILLYFIVDKAIYLLSDENNSRPTKRAPDAGDSDR